LILRKQAPDKSPINFSLRICQDYFMQIFLPVILSRIFYEFCYYEDVIKIIRNRLDAEQAIARKST